MIFPLCRNLLTQCDVIKILAGHYLLRHHNVTLHGINFVSCDLVVLGAATRRDPTHKVIMCIYIKSIEYISLSGLLMYSEELQGDELNKPLAFV